MISKSKDKSNNKSEFSNSSSSKAKTKNLIGYETKNKKVLNQKKNREQSYGKKIKDNKKNISSLIDSLFEDVQSQNSYNLTENKNKKNKTKANDLEKI